MSVKYRKYDPVRLVVHDIMDAKGDQFAAQGGYCTLYIPKQRKGKFVELHPRTLPAAGYAIRQVLQSGAAPCVIIKSRTKGTVIAHEAEPPDDPMAQPYSNAYGLPVTYTQLKEIKL